MDIDPAHAQAYIINPLTGRKMQFANLFRTHPPTEDRIAPPPRREWELAGRASVAEVLELQGDAEVAVLQRRDDGLEVVALLAGDAELIALGLGLDALQAEVLDELVELAGLVRRDAGVDRRRAGGRCRPTPPRPCRTRRPSATPTAARASPRAPGRTAREPVLGRGVQRDLLVAELDRRSPCP